MPQSFGAPTLVLMLGMVWTRTWPMSRQGLRAVHFGQADRTDFLILPFALFYVYTVFAATFDFPTVGTQPLFRSGVIAWVGQSFRVGSDADRPGGLVTTGVFAFSRDPIYVAFIDSTPLAVRHNRRSSRHRVFKDRAARGKNSMGWSCVSNCISGSAIPASSWRCSSPPATPMTAVRSKP